MQDLRCCAGVVASSPHGSDREPIGHDRPRPFGFQHGAHRVLKIQRRSELRPGLKRFRTQDAAAAQESVRQPLFAAITPLYCQAQRLPCQRLRRVERTVPCIDPSQFQLRPGQYYLCRSQPQAAGRRHLLCTVEQRGGGEQAPGSQASLRLAERGQSFCLGQLELVGQAAGRTATLGGDRNIASLPRNQTKGRPTVRTPMLIPEPLE